MGAIYAFIALGYTLVYGIIRLINFAHGEFFMAGAFAGYFSLNYIPVEKLNLPHPLPSILALLLAFFLSALTSATIALIVERFAYRPIRAAGRISALLTALGVSLFLQNLGVQVFSAEVKAYPESHIWPISEAGKKVLIVALLSLSTLALTLFVKYTRAGKAMRAVSYDIQTSKLMGINVNRVIALTFFIGAFLAGICGVVYGMRYGKVEPYMGFLPGLKAFVAAVLGGIGSIPGAVIGGLILGFAEIMVQAYGPSDYRDAVAFGILILILIARPRGILGVIEGEKV